MGIEDIYRYYVSSTGVSTDSRRVKHGSMFFALRGEKFNGNIFAASALSQGASVAVIDDPDHEKGDKTILVRDVLTTLQELARHHKAKLQIPLIGLTGTNGKTTTKELISGVLSKKFRTHATGGNLNNHIGVPLTILGITAETEMAVIEMGASHSGEIATLCNIARPDYGVITNIGKAHLEGFGSFEGVIRAKTELYDYLEQTNGIAVVNYDDNLLMKLSGRLQRRTYGQHMKADCRAEMISAIPFLKIKWRKNQIMTRLYGDYNFENIMAAICIGDLLGVEEAGIADAIASYTPANSRSQLLVTSKNRIFLDAYNANPSSMLASIRNFEMQESAYKALILGDMLELGEASYEEHLKILQAIKGKFDKVILVGSEFKKACHWPGIKAFNNTGEAKAWLDEHPVKGMDILIKGSRGIALENLIDYL